MGEVFRATDSKLNRDVALKLLPPHLSSDKERMARFHREAQVLASLNHPNIAGIHGLEESGAQTALVMELVEGEDLSERLRHGPIPMIDALRIARQVAEALEAAHDKSIIHRDLKPANIKITPDGQVKVLDFGLAKALEGAATSLAGDSGASMTLSASMTRAGTVMGTVAYMSPEQASGAPVDKRSDIWSFGVVLFELLAGRRLFEGETTSHTMADVLRAEIDWSRLPAATPPVIRKLLERCLERDRKRRLQAIGEARILIEDYLASTSSSLSRVAAPVPAAAPVAAPVPVRAARSLVPWAVAAAAIVAALAAMGLLWSRGSGSAGGPDLRVDMLISDRPLFTDVGSSLALSPDATRLAYVDGSTQGQKLYVRPFNQLESLRLSEGSTDQNSPYQPFFSPDGQWVGYVTSSELRKVPVGGGTPLTLCRLSRSRGATWLPDGTIVFAGNPATGLSRVSAAGGEPQAITTLDKAKKEVTHRWPQALPGGKAVVFTSHIQASSDFDNATIEVLVLASGERKVLLQGGSGARYLPSGHLVYASKAAIFAVPFDLGSLTVTGSPAPVVQNVFWNPTEGAAQFSVSESGVLTYLRGGPEVAKYGVVSVDRKGGTTKLIDQPGAYANPRLSPDGRRLALTELRDGNFDIWSHDLDRGVPTRLTFDEAPESEQIWSPDGRFLIFSSGRTGPDNLYRKRADGSGDEEHLIKSDSPMWAVSWARDGASLGLVTMGANGNFDVASMTLADKKVHPILSTNFREADPDISPDGRWLAYTSNESARVEVYVRPYPTGAGRWQVSDNGGAYPRWSSNGREIVYRVDDGIMVASIDATGESIRTGKPQKLFTGPFRGGSAGISIGGNTLSDYDVSADGQRFIMFPSSDTTAGGRGVVTLVTTWFDEKTQSFTTTR